MSPKQAHQHLSLSAQSASESTVNESTQTLPQHPYFHGQRSDDFN